MSSSLRSSCFAWLRVSVLGVALLAPGCASAVEDQSATEEADLSATDQAVATFAATSKKTLYVSLTSKTGKVASDALVQAAKRGVVVRGIVDARGSFNPAWTLQQHLESSGVDVDVRNDVVPGVLAVSEDTALLAGAVPAQEKDAAKVAAFQKKFTDILDWAHADLKGTLIAPGAVAVHPMPESGRDRIIQVIGAAKSTIDLSIYQLQDKPVVAALVAAAGRKVKVRVMLEPRTVGAANFDAVSVVLKAGGVTVKATPKAFDSSHNVDHAKFCLIDDKELLFGTGNLVRSGLGGADVTTYDNRDFWIEDARPAALKEARALFDADFAETSTANQTFNVLVVTPDNANGKIGALIDGAKHRLFVANQSLSDAALQDKIVAAKKRGVDVQVLLGYQPPFGGGSPPNQPAITALQAAGIKADYLKKHYLHAKVIVADDAVYLGSQNFTNGGLRNNREVGEILTDAKVVTTVVNTFISDSAN
jgi:phosphatidylserine/phosphatidylglycerophosphate/cardiolipin synthase-like enzyme